MGRFGTPQIGYLRDDVDRDIPELNKCPNCEAFFEGDVCPVCKTVCPEEMKAGNRVAPKKKKKKEKSIGYKVPLPIYQRTWFIILMLFVSKVVGIILIWTSEWKKWIKITVTVLALGGGYLIMLPLINLFTPQPPETTDLVNYAITETEYREMCDTVDYSDLMRYPEKHADGYYKLELTVLKITVDSLYDDEFNLPVSGEYWFCTDADGNKYILFDCRKKSGGIITNDVITVYSEFAELGSYSVFYNGVNEKLPLFYTAYADVVKAA